MKTKSRKVFDEKQNKIIIRWFIITCFVYFPSVILIPFFISKFFIKQDIFRGYYEQFTFQIIMWLGLTVCFVGFILNELMYLVTTKKYKLVITFMVIFVCGCSISYILLREGYLYKYYKDLSYVKEGVYLEKIQKLKSIYKENEGKAGTTIYMETTDCRFIIDSDIIEAQSFNEFKAKYNSAKYVKIRYLPNSNRLLYVEPADYENAKK